MSGRIGKGLFVVELLVLALPAIVAFALSFSALANLSSVVVPLGDGGASPWPGLPVLIMLGLFGLTVSSFCVLAFRYVAGGGDSVGRVTPIVWGLAILGQTLSLPSVVWAGLSETAPDPVRAVAILTFPVLGLFIPLVHMLVAATIARRGRVPPSPA
ncbi:hypothetical protein [Methylopila sp. M107]|uniref:hypothetical protein n=1 Tax=Methylopila sp. M107 TaxID=1101190 RepID=UPI00036D706D|nr:hypothetical protein [Methylopila sp. M107]